ncbi:MAG: hypothetical protein J6B12_04545 [Clostridia bacterium]|nr:hypothetical protein [Clostridia bacterium]
MERILADTDAPKEKKRARVIGSGAFTRAASAIAACFVLVFTISFMLRGNGSEFYVSVGGESLRRAGESVALGDLPMPLGRLAESPMGIPFQIEGEDAVTLTLEGGELWTADGEESELPYVAKEGETVYLVPDMSGDTRLTLEANGQSVTYKITGNDPADIKIQFEK